MLAEQPDKGDDMVANWITLSRFPMLLLTILALYFGSAATQMAGVALLFLGLMLDTVDGVVARRTGRTSLFGSVLDIAADRTYELVLWFCFADLRMIPMAIPLLIVGRTTLTDALRSLGVGQGTAPFAQHQGRLSRFLVASSVMRIAYSTGKVITFCGLGLAHALSTIPRLAGAEGASARMMAPLGILAWATATMCLVRGVPVIIDSLRRYWRPSPLPEPANARG